MDKENIIYKGLPELLAPAGSVEAFKAAVENGADAIYLGGKLFNARQYAGNFDNIELEKAIDFAHVRDVKVYLTMNTLVSDSEIKEAIAFVGQAYNMGIDGIIIQDLGLADLIRKEFPDLKLHASTQMTIYNIDGVNCLADMGFERVVLARELSIAEVNNITRNCNIEIEMFIHGALCISYSGQCLMSSILGGRSGNRGKCAQPCRLPYKLINDGVEKKHVTENSYDIEGTSKSYILSPKDICTIENLNHIVNAGVKSLKIEGRMKSPEYVATVVKTYRKYLDKVLEDTKIEDTKSEHDLNTNYDKDIKNLYQVFNRGGFSKGYLYGKTGINMISQEKPKNWGIYIGKVVSIDNKARTIKVKLEDNLAIGDGIEIWSKVEGESPGTVVSEIIKNQVNIKNAGSGDIITVGRLSGKINPGDKVYKTSDKKLMDMAKETWVQGFSKKVTIWGELDIKLGEVCWFSIKDDAGNFVKIRGNHVVEKALNVKLTEERVREQITKTGGTPFEFKQLSINLSDGVALPIKELNDIRRRALEELELKKIRSFKRNYIFNSIELKNDNKINKRLEKEGQNLNLPGISLLFYKLDNEQEISKIIDLVTSVNVNKSDNFNELNKLDELQIRRIYLPFRTFLNHLRTEKGVNILNDLISILKDSNIETYIWLPSITKGNYDVLIKRKISSYIESGLIDGILVGNLGTLKYLLQFSDIKIACDYSFNVFNSNAAETLYNLGASCITLSYELTLEQIKTISNNLTETRLNVLCSHEKLYIEPKIVGTKEKDEKEIVVYGRIPLMTSEYCPVGALNDANLVKSENNNSNTCGVYYSSACNNKSCTQANYFLEDRMKELFPIYCDRIDCRTTIFNSKVLFMADKLDKIIKADAELLRINIWDESIDEVETIIKMYNGLLKSSYDNSVDFKNYENEINRIRNKGFTRGHYFRGI